MYTVKHSSPYFNGVRCGITFANGQCIVPTITDVQRFHFDRWGITIEDDSPKVKKGRSEKSEGEALA